MVSRSMYVRTPHRADSVPDSGMVRLAAMGSRTSSGTSEVLLDAGKGFGAGLRLDVLLHDGLRVLFGPRGAQD
jgi:hypothetical protein